jgi:hypothetical protein
MRRRKYKFYYADFTKGCQIQFVQQTFDEVLAGKIVYTDIFFVP